MSEANEGFFLDHPPHQDHGIILLSDALKACFHNATYNPNILSIFKLNHRGSKNQAGACA